MKNPSMELQLATIYNWPHMAKRRGIEQHPDVQLLHTMMYGKIPSDIKNM
jgi:hypothetical protein